MTWTLCTSGAIIVKAGANANSTAVASSAILAQFQEQAEAIICTNSNFNWVDKYSSLNDDVKGILQDATSNLAAMYLVSYDMSGYTSRGEATNIIDLLNYRLTGDLKFLEDQTKKDFIKGA